MYNKLFSKILDSTIWLEDDATRLVWITFLAVMDEDGFVALSAVGNVAARARVSIEAAEAAIKALESPDKSDQSQDHEGRRIERVPYGWMVLNAAKYRDIVARATARESTRERVRQFRQRNGPVTACNAASRPETQSEAVSEAVAVSKAETKVKSPVAPLALPEWLNAETWNSYIKIRPARARTPESLKAALEKLEKFRAQGHDANEIVANSLSNGWQMLKPPDPQRGAARPSVAEHNRAAADEAIRRRQERDERVVNAKE